jgi:thiosulfate/3-mercaptopyruvate sulfurtransferase
MPYVMHRVALAAAVVTLATSDRPDPRETSTSAKSSLVVQTPASLLVTPRQLARELNDPSLVLLQVGPKPRYDAAHIAGARFVSLRDIAMFDSATNVVLDLPDEASLRASLERFGIGDNSRIVVVPDTDWISPSTRVVWTLQAAGLGARTRLLDGGTLAWQRAGLPLTADVPPAPKPGKLTRPADREIVVDHAWVESHAHAPRVRLVDGRAPVFYDGPGMPEHNSPGGHIPGAVNIPFNSLTDDSLHFLPLDELRRKFAAAGVQPGDTVAAYCFVGQQATVVLFSARMLGHPIRLYDGSMADWRQRKLPIENSTPKSPDQRPVRGERR